MRLDTWVKKQGRGAKALLARKTGLGFNTILYLVQGKRIASSPTALLIERATAGEVTVRELITPRPKRKPTTKRRRRVRVRKARVQAAAA